MPTTARQAVEKATGNVQVWLEAVPLGLHAYVSAPEAVRSMEVVVQVIVPLEGVTDTVGRVVSAVTVTLPVEVQPLLWVTVTVYVPAAEAEKLDVVAPPGLHK